MASLDIPRLISEPLRFTIPLTFPDEDKQAYPWLNEKDRYYKIEKQLGQGGYSLAFLGFACTADGQKYPGSEPVVIKIPNLRPDHLSGDTSNRLRYIQQQSITEWELVRRKLIKCKNANPIFDMGTVWVPGPPLTELYVTAQPYLSSSMPLRDWLVEQRLRDQVNYDENGEELNWHGISNWERWLYVSMMIGDAISEIHKHRIIHGDIWPPNIYIRGTDEPYPVLIDFGESFLVMPSGEPRTQPNHPYRAPEREKAASVKTEQVDVYSFGKLMLYLAIGINRVIPRSPDNELIYGHERRAWVRTALFQGNPELVKSHPEIVDLISQCVESDPAGRPTMLEICDQLHELTSRQSAPASRLDQVADRLQRSVAVASLNQLNNIFLRLIERKIVETERLVESCNTEMVEINGTRDELITALVNLFGELNSGDSWTSLTTPAVWQHSALGLDGRYATAAIHALRRRAAIQRAYVVSVEELGIEWTQKLVNGLLSCGVPSLLELAKKIQKSITDCAHWIAQEECRQKSQDYMRQHQRRFALVIESLLNISKQWSLEKDKLVCKEKFTKINETRGLFVGLIPTGTESRVREMRAMNPVSLMHFSTKMDENDRWLLVMTDIRGRNENEPIDDRPSTASLGTSKAPQLRRVRVYKSVMGVPNDRILSLEKLLREDCIHIGAVLAKLHECITAVN